MSCSSHFDRELRLRRSSVPRQPKVTCRSNSEDVITSDFGLIPTALRELGTVRRFSIDFVYRVCEFLPSIGLLAAFLPEISPADARARARGSSNLRNAALRTAPALTRLPGPYRIYCRWEIPFLPNRKGCYRQESAGAEVGGLSWLRLRDRGSPEPGAFSGTNPPMAGRTGGRGRNRQAVQTILWKIVTIPQPYMRI